MAKAALRVPLHHSLAAPLFNNVKRKLRKKIMNIRDRVDRPTLVYSVQKFSLMFGILSVGLGLWTDNTLILFFRIYLYSCSLQIAYKCFLFAPPQRIRSNEIYFIEYNLEIVYVAFCWT
jgi:hypothetical protein